ncbi:hypothetical protein B0H16DRAFT_1301561, partial [Mycena metata]
MARPLTLITPPDEPTHIPSGNVIDLGFASPSLVRHFHSVEVVHTLGLGSDHWPIVYELDLERVKVTTQRYNQKKMDLDLFLDTLRCELDVPLPTITNQRELDDAVDFLCRVIIFAVGESTPLCRPSKYGKRWWSKELAVLQTALSRAER